MSKTASSLVGGEDIFDKNQIKFFSYDEYYTLSRIEYVGSRNRKHYYKNKFSGAVLESDHEIKTLDDYKDYLLIVY
ncbi:lef10 [Euproctis pseudoconspersa nucleopolyhedrovirus]|uniref:Lef10 n=1 Tax=Euproctis pseudoconspersa nucleopolyhedrovirus TaxID=307467 RepID=C3TWU6_9ABAC|nr:lef10 [Euproctis pseudoconspersa nucleopolyhedrovirus]ACO53487.1 lef10 [Euproctis pseudoconspersa nucleopolyhedrovirus]QUJ09227.1 lef10 protein [Gynaephora ruoergensis nucleopolyhedrovirus]